MRQVAESILFCLCYITVPFLPRFAVVALANLGGSLAFIFSVREKRVALANLQAVYGDSMTQAEREKTTRESFRSMALVLLDVLWFGRFTSRRISRYVGFDRSYDVFFGTHPLVVVPGHLGNWEAMGLAVALRGAPTMSVVMPLKNRFVDGMLNRSRRSTGQKVVEREGAVRALIRELQNGGRVALLLDQNTLPEEGGVFVDTLGLPAPVSKAAAAVARKTGAPIVCVWCVPDRRGFYTSYASELIRVEAKQTDEDVTQKVVSVFDDVIRRHPGNWLWMYKRWKYVPRHSSADRYPFYAREYGSGGDEDSGETKGKGVRG